MKHQQLKIAGIFLLAGVLAACGTQPATEPPTLTAPPPTATDVPPTELPPTDTPVPTDTAEPTEETTSAPALPGQVSFANDILPIIQSRCINCHGGQRTEEGLVMRTHADIMAGSDNGPVVIPGDPANSSMAELVASNEMPKRGPKLTPPQVQLIIDWINQGALNN